MSGPVVGTVRGEGRLLFVAGDDGNLPNIFLHNFVAQRCGLAEPYAGRRVSCDINHDGMGNCVATEVVEMPPGSSIGAPVSSGGGDEAVQIAFEVSHGDIREL